ncbi:hypothetical protein DSO57_1014883 [Entomophthora muscae]|uniref:Uncharacterized protein n=1 Tax=Entomophthora muscae TaxID=34485 RepID=A0ACC2TSZ5_9FUNG|nr:hypothetical protein DSO57_1014883 [Entomophthora muscae]
MSWISKSLSVSKSTFIPIPRSSIFSLASSRSYAAVPEERPVRRTSKHLIKLGAIPLKDAIDVLRAFSIGKEHNSFELQIKYDRKKYNRELIGSCILPTPMSQDSKILVFAEGKEADEAIEAGAAVVGGVELIDKVVANEVEFNQVLCTPAMFPHVLKIARTLGPRGLMPTPKKGNVTGDIAGGIKKLQALYNFHSDSEGWIRLSIAKVKHNSLSYI